MVTFLQLNEVLQAHLLDITVKLIRDQPEGLTLPRLLEGVPVAWGEQRLGRASASGGLGY